MKGENVLQRVKTKTIKHKTKTLMRQNKTINIVF